MTRPWSTCSQEWPRLTRALKKAKNTQNEYWRIHYRLKTSLKMIETRKMQVKLFRIQTSIGAWKRRHMSTSVLEDVSICYPLIHHIEKKRSHKSRKIRFFIVSRKQSNHIMNHLWIQTDHNLDHKCPHYGQPLIINMCGQTMIRLESCSTCYHSHDQPAFLWEVKSGYFCDCQK